MPERENPLIDALEFILQDRSILESFKRDGNVLIGENKKVVANMLKDKTVPAIQPIANDTMISIFYDDSRDIFVIEISRYDTEELIAKCEYTDLNEMITGLERYIP